MIAQDFLIFVANVVMPVTFATVFLLNLLYT